MKEIDMAGFSDPVRQVGVFIAARIFMAPIFEEVTDNGTVNSVLTGAVAKAVSGLKTENANTPNVAKAA